MISSFRLALISAALGTRVPSFVASKNFGGMFASPFCYWVTELVILRDGGVMNNENENETAGVLFLLLFYETARER